MKWKLRSVGHFSFILKAAQILTLPCTFLVIENNVKYL